MSTCPCHPGFSLVEIMIATIILGFGLLMIGAVLPIAWKGSIDASAYTKAEGATQAASYYVAKNCRADGPRDLFDPGHNSLGPPDGTADSVVADDLAMRDGASCSLLGDYDTIDADINDDGAPDPLVHALNLQNWAIDEDSTFISGLNGSEDHSSPEAPILIEIPEMNLRRVGIPADLRIWDTSYNPLGLDRAIGAPVVRLADRVFPPIQDNLTPTDPQWLEALNARNIAWAVLHKLARVPNSNTDPRYFHVYHVTLRRGSTTARFARQDPSSGIVPTVPPTALGPEEDVMFPVAWRVPLVIIESASGLPSIAFAGAENVSDLGNVLPAALQPAPPLAPIDNQRCRVADMFPRGSIFVDEASGAVYKVSDREFVEDSTGNVDVLARLTLDIGASDADLDLDVPPDGVQPDERNRVVWVFPPAVSPDRGNGVQFVGGNPVVDIRVEPMTLLP